MLRIVDDLADDARTALLLAEFGDKDSPAMLRIRARLNRLPGPLAQDIYDTLAHRYQPGAVAEAERARQQLHLMPHWLTARLHPQCYELERGAAQEHRPSAPVVPGLCGYCGKEL